VAAGNLCRPLQLTEIAQQTRERTRTLQRRFAAQRDTPLQMLNPAALQRAQELAGTSDLSMEAVAVRFRFRHRNCAAASISANTAYRVLAFEFEIGIPF